MNAEEVRANASETGAAGTPDMEKMAKMAAEMNACPCSKMMKGGGAGAYVCMGVMGLVFLAAVTGIILGVIAFFRTL